MRDKCGITMINRFSIIRRVTLLLVILNLNIALLYGTESIWVQPYEIKFNYEAGQTNDALTIRKVDGSTISDPEWSNYNTENFAYIMSQSNRKIQVKFDSNCEDMHLIINLTVTSGTGIGEICNLFVCNYHRSDWVTLTLNGMLPGTIGKRTFTWEWEIYGIPVDGPNFCADWETTETIHSYYTLLNIPELPEITPRTDILDYACEWASGSTNENQVCVNILSNGFNQHYTWNLDCHLLSSDFVRLVSSLGLSASLHRWASFLNGGTGSMLEQKTIAIDPVGSSYGQGQIIWEWHQWAEAASYQRDPSTNTSLLGNWGAYEDYLFFQYFTTFSDPPYNGWVANQSGQSVGCEAPNKRIYTTVNILRDWRGPDR